MEEIAQLYFENNAPGQEVSAADIDVIVDASLSAQGHIKYWSHYYKGGVLFIYIANNNSTWDKSNTLAYAAIGAALEQVHIKAAELGLQDIILAEPLSAEQRLIATISFVKSQNIGNNLSEGGGNSELLAGSNNFIKTQPLPFDFVENLQYFVKPGEGIHILYTDKAEDIATLASVAGASQRLQLLDADGHHDFYKHISWNGEGEGTDARELGFTDAEIGGYSVARDWQATNLLSKWNKGNAFKLMAAHKASTASGMLLMVLHHSHSTSAIAAGRALESVKLYCNSQGISTQLFSAPTVLVNKEKEDNYKATPDKEKELSYIKDKLFKTFGLNENEEGNTQVFLMKLVLPAKVNE